MRSMGDPGYVYRPLPAKTRKRMSAVARKRLGIPRGYRRIFGALVDEAHADEVRKAMMHYRHCKARRA